MPRLTLMSLMTVVTIATTVSAQEIQFTSNAELASLLHDYDDRLASIESNSMYGSTSDWMLDCRPPGLTGEAEATLFRYYRADGVRTVSDDNDRSITFDLKAAPRITIGYLAANGMGIRGRWWDFSQVQTGNAMNPGDFVDVETYNIDLEVFHEMALNDIFDMEISAGGRYNEFREELRDAGNPGDRFLNEFDGIGLLGALEFRGHLHRHGAVFGRGRVAALIGDRVVEDNTGVAELNDTIQGVYELAIGYEYSRILSDGSVAFAEVAGEIQHWQNFSSAYEDMNSSGDFGGSPADVGFAGLVFSAGVRR